MAEPTLTLDYNALAAEIGEQLGFTSDSSKWAVEGRQARIDRIIGSGLRKVLTAHNWNFFRPNATLNAFSTTKGTSGTNTSTTIVATTSLFYPEMIGQKVVYDTSATSFTITGYTSATTVTVDSDPSAESSNAFTITPDGRYRLPDNFGGLYGELTFAPDITSIPIRVLGEQALRRKIQVNNDLGRPAAAAVRPVILDSTVGQRHELLLHPIPDKLYLLDYRFTVLLKVIDATNKFSGMSEAYSECLLAACRAVAEQRFFDTKDIDDTEYKEMLALCVRQDRLRAAPETYGYNADRSEVSGVYSHRTAREVVSAAVTYNGVTYTG